MLQDKSVPQEALIRALKIYSPSEKASSCQMILQATHALLEASMHLCRAAAGDVRGESKEGWGEAEVGVFWTCFLIKHMPMVCPPSPPQLLFYLFILTFYSSSLIDSSHGPRSSIPNNHPFPPYIHPPPPAFTFALASLIPTMSGSAVFGFTSVGDVGYVRVCGIVRV